MEILKKGLRIVIFLGIGILFIWLSVRELNDEQINSIFENINTVFNTRGVIFILLSMGFNLLAHYIRTLRNILLIHPLGYKPRKSITFYSVLVCYSANLAVPRLGEVLRCTFLQRYEKIPFQKTFGTIVTERIIDLLAWMLILFVAILLNTQLVTTLELNSTTGETLGMWAQNKCSLLLDNYLLLAGMAVAGIGGIFAIYKTKNTWSKWPFFDKITHFFGGLWAGIISLKKAERPGLFLFYTFLLWFLYYMSTYACFFAFDFLDGLGPMPAFVVLAMSTVAFIVAQGGLGVYPVLVAGILMMYGVEYTQGLAAGWVGWTAQTILVLLGGAISMILVSISKRKMKDGEISQ